MARRLLKLKYKQKENLVFVKYEEDRKNDITDTITLETTDPPRNELVSALQTMAKHLVDIIEAPGSWRDHIVITSVTVTWSNDVQGLVITGLRTLDNSNSPMVINTPHFTRVSYNEESNSDMNIFSYDCGLDLDNLCEYVFRYVDGDRKQLTLDFQEEKDRLILSAADKVLEPVGR